MLHREFLCHFAERRTVNVYQPDDSLNIVELLLVTDLEIRAQWRERIVAASATSRLLTEYIWLTPNLFLSNASTPIPPSGRCIGTTIMSPPADMPRLRKALEMKPEEIIKTVTDSGLRGRGGAGFSAGQKWSFIPKEKKGPHYLAVNADESEPGTFKDRYLMDYDPHSDAGGHRHLRDRHAGGCRLHLHPRRISPCRPRCWSRRSRKRTTTASLGSSGIFGSKYKLECYVHRGAGAYICGEETGLLEALEGKRGWPRNKPPFPAIAGAFAQADGHQ